MTRFHAVYYAFALGTEEDADFVSVLWDAVPRDDVVQYLRLLREVRPDSERARNVQSQFLAEYGPDRGLVIRGDFPKEGKQAFSSPLRSDRWYSLVLRKDGPLQVWSAGELLTAEPLAADILRIRTLRGPLRNQLDNLFMLRGRPEGEGPDPHFHELQPEGGDGAFCEIDLKRFDRTEARAGYAATAYRAAVDKVGMHRHGTGTTHRHLGILNVGQGACAAVYDEALRPIAYIDMGFPTGTYVKTAPWNLRYLEAHGVPGHAVGSLNEQERRSTRQCLCQAPLIVLSHADHDHWFGMSLQEKRIREVKCPVLAPAPMTAPSLLPLWGRLPNTDTMPQGEWRSFPWGYLVTCMGRGRNQSGIAAFVRVKDSPNHSYPAAGTFGSIVPAPVFRADEEYVLLPGDAEFRNIPWPADISNLRLVGLMASHHGANFTNKSAFDGLPAPAFAGAPIVYSYGLHDAGPSELLSPTPTDMARLQARFGGAVPTSTQKRCYTWRGKGGHPRQEAIDRYEARDWTARRNTAREDPLCGPWAPWGNWMITSREMALAHGRLALIYACASVGCPMNDGCRAEEFSIG